MGPLYAVLLVLLGPTQAGTATIAPATPRAVPEAEKASHPQDFEDSEAEGNALDREEPLSAEEIRMIESLAGDGTETSTGVAAPRDRPRDLPAPAPRSWPELRLLRPRLRESVARSVTEAFEAVATVVDSARRHLSGDSARVRGQTGHRIALYLDDIPLQHALSASRENAGLYTIDPWMLDEVILEGPASIEPSPRGTAGAIRLTARAPRAQAGYHADVEATTRSADRSSGGHVSASIAEPFAGISLALGYEDRRALRIATSSVGREWGGGLQRAGISARGRLFGREQDTGKIDAGFDFDQLLNVRRPDLDERPSAVDRASERLLAFVRGSLTVDRFSASLITSRQAFRRKLGVEGSLAPTSSEEALSYFLRAQVDYRVIDGLVLRAGGLLDASTATRKPSGMDALPLGAMRLANAFLGGDLSMPRITASTHLAFVHAQSTLESPQTTVEANRLLFDASARLAIVGPLGVRGSVTQKLYVPTVQDLRDAGAVPLAPERSLGFDLGPSLHGRYGWAEVLGFITRLEHAIEASPIGSPRLVQLDSARIAGVELTVGLLLVERLGVTGSLTWADGWNRDGRANALVSPSLMGRVSVRYDLPIRRAFLEARIRTSTNPLHVFSVHVTEPPMTLAESQPSTFAVLGLSGAMDLGLGFRLWITLENVLDAPYRSSLSLVPGAGTDLRASLSWAFD